MLKSNWKLERLDKVLKVVRGSSPRPIKNFITDDIKGVNWIKIGDVGENEKYVISTKEKITLEGAERSRFVDVGDFIFSNSMSFGRAYIMKIPGYIHDGWFTFKLPPELDSHYLWYLFKSPYLIEQIKQLASGAIVQNISSDLVKKCLLPIPPLEEQQTIVAKLDQAFTAIDQAKANIEKNIANAKELFQSKLNQIFSQKGEGWVEKRIKEIGKVQTGTTPPTKDKDNYGEFIPFIKPAHFNSDGSLTPLDSYLSEKGIKKSRLIEANSVLMVCIGATIGKTGFTEIDITCNQQINAVTPSKNYNYKFIYFGMISRIFQDEVLENGKGAQATLPIINKSKWENLFLNVNLNKDVQQQIVTQLDQLQEQTNLLVTKYQQKLANLEELKKSILEKAFKGELSTAAIEKV